MRFGWKGGNRTHNRRVINTVLCQLSYLPALSRRTIALMATRHAAVTLRAEIFPTCEKTDRRCQLLLISLVGFDGFINGGVAAVLDELVITRRRHGFELPFRVLVHYRAIATNGPQTGTITLPGAFDLYFGTSVILNRQTERHN